MKIDLFKRGGINGAQNKSNWNILRLPLAVLELSPFLQRPSLEARGVAVQTPGLKHATLLVVWKGRRLRGDVAHVARVVGTGC